MTMLELTHTHSLRDTEVAYTVPSFRVNMVIPALLLPVSRYRDLKSSFAPMTFLCEIDLNNQSKVLTSRANHR